MSSVSKALLAISLALVSTSPLPAQGTAADYQRARDLRKLTDNKVFRDRVAAQWLPGTVRFWYQVKTAADRHEFILVEAEKGLREPAFDHARLAQALTTAGLRDIIPDRLPLDNLRLEESENAISFRIGGKSWRCDLETYALRETSVKDEPLRALPATEIPLASTRTGEETTLTFANRTAAPVELFWLDSEGERQSYGKLGAGEERAQHTFAGHVWLVADSGGKTLALFQAAEQTARAEITGLSPAIKTKPRENRQVRPPRDTSPDGRWRAFIKDHNVMVENLESGEEVALSSDGSPGDSYSGRLHWSPNSKKVVAIRTKQGEDHKVYLIESSPKDQLQPKLHSFEYLKPGDRLALAKPQLFDVEAERQIPIPDDLFPNPWSISDVRWAPDSTCFTFLYNQRGHQVLRILAVDAQSGKVRAVVDEQNQTFIDYSGKSFTEYLDNTGEIIWMSERDGWNHLYLYDAKNGRVKNQITKGEWVVRGVDRVDREKRQIWFRAGGVQPGQDPYYVHYGRVNFDGTGLVLLTAANGTHSIQFSPDRRFYIDTWSRVDLAPVNELHRAEDGRRICELEQGDDSALRKTGWRAPEPFAAKGRDHETDIYGVIVRPTYFDPRHHYPVIENIYAGPQDSFVPKSFRVLNGMQELAELGFVVVQIDGMGTSNRSKKFHDVCWRNLGDAGFPDRILWTRAAAEQYPCLDLTRVGIYGTSAGGQSALGGLLLHGDFYKAGVADCGCHDNRMDKIWWNEQWMGWPIGPHYAQQSNVTLANRLQGKLLLMVGEMDRNVDPASTMQVVNALIKADKDFELLVMPGAGHGVAGTPYGRRRLQAFFVHAFSGAP